MLFAKVCSKVHVVVSEMKHLELYVKYILYTYY